MTSVFTTFFYCYLIQQTDLGVCCVHLFSVSVVSLGVFAKTKQAWQCCCWKLAKEDAVSYALRLPLFLFCTQTLDISWRQITACLLGISKKAGRCYRGCGKWERVWVKGWGWTLHGSEERQRADRREQGDNNRPGILCWDWTNVEEKERVRPRFLPRTSLDLTRQRLS